MKKNVHKLKRMRYIIGLGVLLLFFSSSLFMANNINAPTAQQNEIEQKDQTLSEDLRDQPKTSDTGEYNVSGEGASTGMYGFTNGTRDGSFSYGDDWTEYDGGQYGSEDYLVSTPDYTEDQQPWEVTGNRIEVENLKDKHNYIPDSEFSDSSKWDETDTLEHYGTVSVENGEGVLHFDHRVQKITNFIDSEGWDQDPTFTHDTTFDNNPRGDGEVTEHAKTHDMDVVQDVTEQNNIVTVKGGLESYAKYHVTQECSSRGWGDCVLTKTCRAEPEIDLHDNLDVTFEKVSDAFYIEVEPDNVDASISYSLDFDSPTWDYWDDYINKDSGGFTEGDWGVKVISHIRHVDGNWKEISENSYSTGTQNINEDISDLIDDESGQYEIRFQVEMELENIFWGKAYDFYSCWDSCSTAEGMVEAWIEYTLQAHISNLDLEVEAVPQGGELALSVDEPMGFDNRTVEQGDEQRLYFDVRRDNDLDGRFGNSQIFTEVTINKGEESQKFNNTYSSLSSYGEEFSSESWALHDEDNFNTWLDGADSVKLRIGAIDDGMVIDWDAGENTNMYFDNVSLELEGRPNVEDINLQLWCGDEDPIDIEDEGVMGEGATNLPYDDIDLDEDTLEYEFLTTSESLEFDFYHTLELSYATWGHTFDELVSEYYAFGDDTAEFRLNFTITTPWSEPDNFQEDKTYQDTFYFKLIFPKFEYNMETYWALSSALARWNGGDSGEVEHLISTPGVSPGEEFGDHPETTQYAIIDNDLLGSSRFNDGFIHDASQELEWNIKFTSPNRLTDIVLAGDNTFESEKDSFIAGEESIWIKGTLGHAPETGELASIGVVSPSPSFEPVDQKVADIDTEKNTTHIEIDLPNTLQGMDDYIAEVKYNMSDIGNSSQGSDISTGIYTVGFQKAYFDVQEPTYADLEIINQNIDPLIQEDELIKIRAQYNDSDEEPIENANATITMVYYRSFGDQDRIETVLYDSDGWDEDTEMKYEGDGWYTAHIDPSILVENGELTFDGNITWGFYDFTVDLQKEGHVPQTLEGNFSVKIDTYLEWRSPEHDEDTPHPYYMERFAGDALSFQSRYRKSDGTVISNDTGLYRDAVHLEYNLVNSTDNLINWSRVDSIIEDDPDLNPINGSFEEIATGIYEGAVRWPTFRGEGDDPARYEPGITLAYNVTAWVLRNETKNEWDPDDPDCDLIHPQFQPEDVSDAWLKEETTLHIRLEDPTRANRSRFVLMNDPDDNHNNHDAFATGQYNNGTEIGEEARYIGYDVSGENYEITNYYQNTSAEWFRLRGIFECYEILHDPTFDAAPPVGPLNQTNEFYGEELNWTGDTSIRVESTCGTINFDMDVDEDYTWETLVNASSANEDFFDRESEPINATGVTYETPQINFSDFPAGEYDLRIYAEKEGFHQMRWCSEREELVEGGTRITLNILPQETAVYDEQTKEIIDTDDNPLQLSVPRGNTSSFIIQYNDTTNVGEEEFIDDLDAITVIDERETPRTNMFVNATGGVKDTWGYEALGNGRYRINIYDTDISPREIELTFRLEKENYTAGEFIVELETKPRNATLELKWIQRDGKTVYCDTNLFDPLDDEVTNLILSYEIQDHDNNSNAVDLRKIPGIGEAHIENAFNIDGFGHKLNITTDESTGNIRYNITIGANRDPDEYTVKTSLYSATIANYFELPLENNTGEVSIAEVSTNITITDERDEMPFLHYEDSMDTTRLPKITFQYWDENHSIQLDPAALTADGNWSNEWNTGESSIAPESTNEDLRLETEGNLGYLYFDTQMINASDEPYIIDITLDRTNYEIVEETFEFTIRNQETRFRDDEMVYEQIIYRDTWELNWGDLNNPYQENDLLELYWGTYLSVGFRYRADENNRVWITNDTDHDMPIYYEFEGIDSSLRTSLMDEGNGRYRFDLDFANITQEGAVPINFNITIGAKNFEPVTFNMNITITDRPSFYDITRTPSEDLKWTETAKYQVQFIDEEFHDRFGSHGDFYIDDAAVNDTAHGENSTLTIDGVETSWWVEELSQGRYNVYINTTNLKVRDEPYSLTFGFDKPHYDSAAVPENLSINPVELNAMISFDPSGSFTPDEVQEVTIKVNLFITTFEWDGTRDIEREQEINVDYSIDDISVIYEIRDDDGDLIFEGELEWDDAEQAFVATFPTEIDDETLAGLYDVTITAETDDKNIESTTASDRIISLGMVEGELPAWFYPLLFVVIASAVGMAGYAIKKAIYLRIPFVLRKIDETIKKIEKDKYPAVGVMTGREEFIINSVISVLDEAGIEWEREEKFKVKKVGEVEAREEKAPLSVEEIQAELEAIPGLSKEEQTLFMDELKRLDRQAQDEFLASLKGDIEEQSLE